MKTIRQTRREARQLFRLCLVNGRLDDGRTRLVLDRVMEARRRGYQALLSHFRRLVKLEIARYTALVESAVPLPEELRAGVKAGLERTYGPGVTTSFEHNPALIGGMRVKVGSDVYDGSVRAGLAALEKRF
jgi:F-type H+-transporting ATPase subunit delta